MISLHAVSIAQTTNRALALSHVEPVSRYWPQSPGRRYQPHKKASARDDAGSIVPLHTSGANRAAINSAAVAFSPYGAMCKAASQNPGTRRRPFQESQRS
jgi:hypothetical protein